MYGHSNCRGSSNDQLPADILNYPAPATSANYLQPPPATFFPPPPLAIPAIAYEFDSVFGYTTTTTTGSGCSGCESPSSLASYNNSPMQRSLSSHSLVVPNQSKKKGTNMVQNNHPSESPLSNESNTIVEGMSKACQYSPEEKKERIKRYRSKRNQRNFNKKIKYVCRKTLADSRPRIRGRFARNDEIEKAPENQYNNQAEGGEEVFYDDDDDNWINFLNSFSANLIP